MRTASTWIAGWVVALSGAAALAAPPVVTVAVQATDTSGGTLSYKWKSTDGAIVNVNAASTTWTLPNGHGLHFAYVLVDNGLGGVTERRIAVSTDSIGTAVRIPASRPLLAPARPAQTDDYWRLFFNWGPDANGYLPAVPGFRAYMQDVNTGTLYPPSGSVVSSARGDITFAGVPVGTTYQVNCSVDGGKTFEACMGAGEPQLVDPATGSPVATTWYIDQGSVSQPDYYGKLVLADGSACGMQNEFFNVHQSGTATLLNRAGTAVGTFIVNESGDYSVPQKVGAVQVRLNCGAAPAIFVPLKSCGAQDCGLGTSVIANVTPPTVQGMTATLNGVVLNGVKQVFDGATPEAIFLPPPSGLPSDILTRPDAYLAEKGLDTAKGGCQYYLAIGAVTGCTATGGLQGSISFEDWKRTVLIDSYAVPGTPQYGAAYINQMDLNLMRQHQSISYSSSQTAAYVCNHLGPAFQLVTPQAAINQSIKNGVNGKNLVACVAMDYGITPGVNGDQPFTRFLIFGPSGQLLPSINLDGRREKYVPGTCVACHGGDHYAGKYPEDGSGPANVGAHFLPYDIGNFEFSSVSTRNQASQEASIYGLNQNVLRAGPTPAEVALINGWYANGQVQNKSYLPPSWQAAAAASATPATTTAFYQDVLARSCRSCHVALREEYNFDHYLNAAPSSEPGAGNDLLLSPDFDVISNVCGGEYYLWRDHMMPNSLVTFNKLWLTYATTAKNLDGTPVPDQVSLIDAFYGRLPPETCGPPGNLVP